MLRLNRMTLRSKINWLVSLNIFFVLLMVVSAVSFIIVEISFRESGERALAVARTVAELPEVVQAFGAADPSRVLQPLAERVRRRTGAEFVVIGNMELIRYSHPIPSEIGRHMVGEDNAEVLQGRESISRAVGILGYSVRGKAPVFDERHRQLGLVSAGFSVQNVRGNVWTILYKLLGIAVVALAAGLAGSHLLSGHVKRQILDMEPSDIAFTVQEQAAILEAIREGIVAVNADGVTVSCNHEAKKLLRREDEELIGAEISPILPGARLGEVLSDGVPRYDQHTVVGNTLAVVNSVPVLLSGKVIGAVATFRDKVELDKIDQRLADIGRYVDTLRSQRHEFMNKLHLISGLIRMSDYESAAAVIGRVNEEYQKAVEFYLARIRDTAIVAILVGKTHRAGELGIRLDVSAQSLVSERSPHREVVVAVLGNCIENAFDALQSAPGGEPAVSVLVREDREGMLVQVADNGPGIAASVRERVFEDGTSTKGEGRGLGLALVKRMVEGCGGTIDCRTTAQGSVFEVRLPGGGADGRA